MWYFLLLYFQYFSNISALLCCLSNLGSSFGVPLGLFFPGEGNGYPLQYSYLENSMDREAWGIVVHGVAEWEKTERLTLYFVTFIMQLWRLVYSRGKKLDSIQRTFSFLHKTPQLCSLILRLTENSGSGEECLGLCDLRLLTLNSGQVSPFRSPEVLGL